MEKNYIHFKVSVQVGEKVAKEQRKHRTVGTGKPRQGEKTERLSWSTH